MSMELCGNCRFCRRNEKKCIVLDKGKEFTTLPTSLACESFEPMSPGPWKAGKNPFMTTVLDGHEGKAIYSKNGSYHIAWANAENEDGEIDIQAALANANLIAAAPDMYAFLENLVNQIEENGLMQYDNGVNLVLEEAKELLRKARGESEVSE